MTNLNFRELVILSGLFLRHPLYLFPTYKATKRTLKISNRLYGELHHKDNSTNAFRHALWNILICKFCLPIAGSPEKAVRWCKKVTDLHERLSPNEVLARAMDLHNNRIGRELFLNSCGTDEELLPLLEQMTKNALKVRTLKEIEATRENLVFIEEVRSL